MGFSTWLFTALARRRVRKVLRARPQLGTGAEEEGAIVSVEGVVRALEPITAPLSGKKCAVYCARIGLFGGGPPPRRRGEQARPILNESVVVSPFLVERAGQPAVLVDGTRALLDVPEVTMKFDSARVDHFLLAHGVSIQTRHPGRLSEWIVEDGMRVRVAGVLMRDPASEPDRGEREFRDAPPAELRLTGTYDHPLAIGIVR